MAQPTPIWRGAVGQDGKLHLESRGLFDRFLHRLRGQGIQLVVKKLQRPKSHSQLGYLFGVVYPVIAEELGYADHEIEALHDALIRRLRGLRPDPNPLGLRVSLSEMSHEDVGGYIEDVRYFAVTELGIVTPDAGTVEPTTKQRRRVAA
jgi:hypothetical protein